MALPARPTIAALGLATALAVSACTAEAKPSAHTPVAASSTTTNSPPAATPTSAAPTTPAVDAVIAKIPPAARPNTQAGAEAFARFFIEQVAQSGAKADPSLLDGLFVNSCKTCAGLQGMAKDLKDKGRRVAKPALRVTSSSANAFTDQAKEVAVTVSAGNFDIVDSDDGVLVETRKERDRFAFVLSLAYQTHWVVELAQVEVPR